jgi:hypothetical protein
MLNGAANSLTEASPSDSRVNIARRVGSDKALKTALKASISEVVCADTVMFSYLVN